MTAQAYVAAQLVAPKVHAYFARHRAEAIQRGQTRIAPLPDIATVERIVDAAFWASLRREEGYVPRISLAYVPPQEAGQPLLFERALPLRPRELTRVAPAVERSGIHLGVWHGQGERRDELCVWGVTHTIPPLGFVLEVAAPGLLVIKHHRGEDTGKFINVAVLEGDQIKLIDEHASTPLQEPALLATLLGFESASQVDSINVLVQLAVSMRLHGRGGSLLIVPAATDTWRDSIVKPIPYGVAPAFTELAQLTRDVPEDGRRGAWQEALQRVVDALAGLTAVDGATIISSHYELLAFGATIARRRGWAQVEHVAVTEPIEGGTAMLVHPEQLGGTRHFSAAQFAHDQRDGLALVASQDGRFTVFAWSPHESVVHAHRIESLLL